VKGKTGKDAAITYMITVTPSINPRTTNPPDHIGSDIVDGETPAPTATLKSTKQPHLPAISYLAGRRINDLDRRLDNSSNGESVWWMACQAT